MVCLPPRADPCFILNTTIDFLRLEIKHAHAEPSKQDWWLGEEG